MSDALIASTIARLRLFAMTWTLFIYIVLALYALGVASLGWHLWRAIHLVREQRTLPPVPVDAQKWPSLDVIIPVKDEENNIGPCIESVLRQDYPGSSVLVVNDRSTDGTVAAVAAIQARCPALRRFDITELPPGMYGKPHAIETVAGGLQSEFVAFVDSDLVLHPACLRTLVDHLIRNRFDWVAVMGAPQVSLFWERLLVPLLGAVTFAWYDPRKISDPAWPNAIGSPLMVTRRSAYEAIGRHGAVISTYDEDSELVRIAKRAGQKVSFILTPELFTQRHYGTFARTIRGMTRTFVGGIKTIPRLLITMNALSFVCLWPIVVAAVVGLGLARGWAIPRPSLWLGLAGLHLILSTGLAFIVYRTAGADRRFAWLHPLGGAVLIGVCLRAIAHLRRREPITWRGTTYSEKAGTH